jgi:hypothetical protein
MELIPIFADEQNDYEKGGLLSINFKIDKKDKDEYYKFFNNWSNTGYLLDFFKSNSKDLYSGFYNEITIDQAIDKTLDELDFLKEKINELVKKGFNSKEINLDNLFQPLRPMDYKFTELLETKAKASGKIISKPWLRLYAVRIDKNLFVITGGTVKLTATMQEREHTRIELEKSKKALAYLKENNINTSDDLIYYYENIE